jgi:hypothetical protein
MSDAFDPYYTWLGIPPEDQPPNHYRLLGLRKYEDNVDVISHAADQRMGHLRTFQSGARAALSQQLLNELAQARICLLDLERKSRYDDQLRLTEAPALPQPDVPEPAVVLPQPPAESSRPTIVAGRPKMSLRRRRRSSGCMTIVWMLLGLAVLGGTIAYFVGQPDLRQFFDVGREVETDPDNPAD